MQIIKLDKRIVKVILTHHDLDVDRHFDNTLYLERAGILTFGDMNSRIFRSTLSKRGMEPTLLDLCFEDDKSIGLDMPRTWYLNKGKHALSIAHYYNYLNFHGVVEKFDPETFNEEIVNSYGRIACIEIYNEAKLLDHLDDSGYPYFGTPRTLTECVRYLEGWNIIDYPRLKGYATFSKFIELWCRLYFPRFNAAEWHLGKEQSQRINKERISNVRESVRFFWENFLLQKHPKIAPEDIEIDILSPTFMEKRQPDILFLSEDLFSKQNPSSVEIFRNLTRRMKKNKIFFAKEKSNLAYKNALLAREQYPNCLIVLLENDSSMPSNFTLINPIKHSLNTDIVLSTKVLRKIIEEYSRYTGKPYQRLSQKKKERTFLVGVRRGN